MDINKTIVIYQQYGGLGDNLQYSTLPELYSKQGYDVYIHTNNVVRNKEIYELVWELNPYIKGKKGGSYNAGTHKWHPSNIPQKHGKDGIPFIKLMEKRHGLPPTNSYPKIYYNPKKISELENVVIVDINSFSRKNDRPNKTQMLINSTEKLIDNKNFKNIQILNYLNITNKPNKYFSSYNKYDVKDIRHLCDIIYSCKVFICGHSGNSCLASAIKQNNLTPHIYCFPNWWPMESTHIFGFPNIEYIELK